MLEARRIQPFITGENANILGALVARQAIDVSDDFIFFSALFDKSARVVADIAEQMPGLAHRAKLPRSLYQTLRHDHRIASLPIHVWQRALHVLQLGQRKTVAGIHQTDLRLLEALFLEQFRAVGADLV